MFAAAVVVVGLAGYLLLWPGPETAFELQCDAAAVVPCTKQVEGRIVYLEASAPGRRRHVALASRSSFSGPGIALLKLPPVRRPVPGLHVGGWLRAGGFEVVGSHGRPDVHVMTFSTADALVRCDWPSGGIRCTETLRPRT